MILRHQLNVLQRKSSKRPTFGMLERLIFAGLYRLAPKVLGALAIVKPETVIKWHRAGFRLYCQSSVGSASNPWRVAQARRRYRTNQRGQVHGQATRPAVPGLEDIPPQSR